MWLGDYMGLISSLEHVPGTIYIFFMNNIPYRVFSCMWILPSWKHLPGTFFWCYTK